jgi:hypothetical protein
MRLNKLRQEWVKLILNLVFYNQDSIHCLLLMNLMVMFFVSEEQKVETGNWFQQNQLLIKLQI